MYLVGTTTPMNIPTDSQSMSIGRDGTVTYVDAAGTLQTVDQIQLAKFPNSEGLTKAGSNYFKESPASGEILQRKVQKEKEKYDLIHNPPL